ncbi:hypothetical protein UPYG_G00215040 [Umbra pygmaea]|uniref:Uncharacterized protein n=1 Tax=Umbra pygmaea TaxID=75934 RepID=A0ABD0WKL8_UMBPY
MVFIINRGILSEGGHCGPGGIDHHRQQFLIKPNPARTESRQDAPPPTSTEENKPSPYPTHGLKSHPPVTYNWHPLPLQ